MLIKKNTHRKINKSQKIRITKNKNYISSAKDGKAVTLEGESWFHNLIEEKIS